MAKKRIIFTLHYNSGYFCLSRNFRLQKAGDLNWLNRNYNFPKIAFSIDELVVLDVSRGERNAAEFQEVLKKLAKEIFVPIAAGGGIKTVQDAKNLFESGADKIVLNTALHLNSDLVRSIAEIYGAQSIIASVDYKLEDNGGKQVYIQNGSVKIDIELDAYLKKLNEMPIGEIYLHSMRQDGTGQGYDMQTYSYIQKKLKKPLIASGGAGNKNHFEEALLEKYIDAASTANLFNFIGNGLPVTRNYLLNRNINLPVFDNRFTSGM